MTLLQVDIKYGEYTLAFSTVEDRTICNLFITDSRQQVLSNRTIAAGPRKDLDYYLAGIEVFVQQAVQMAMRDVGGA